VDILDVIDQAVSGCGWCGDPLDGSSSGYWCGPDCQESWHAARTDELVGYREPWDRPEDFPDGACGRSSTASAAQASATGRRRWIRGSWRSPRAGTGTPALNSSGGRRARSGGRAAEPDR
jgi:hypothetical protein